MKFVISDEEIIDLIKAVKYLEGAFRKGIENVVKKQNDGLLGNLLPGQRTKKDVILAGKQILNLLHRQIFFEIWGCYQTEAQINGLYSTNSLPNFVKDITQVIHPEEYAKIGTDWVAFCDKGSFPT